VAGWDPYLILWLPHDPRVTTWQVVRAYARRMNSMYATTSHEQWPGEAARIGAACRVLCTRSRRRQMLADLAVQPGCQWAFDHPGVRVMAEALLTPLIGGGLSLEEACDRRALEREAAALRLERAGARHAERSRWWRARRLYPRG
jgi:hypothetical protein